MNDILVNVLGGEINEEEKKAYIKRGIEKYGRALNYIDLKLDGEFVDIHYLCQSNNIPLVYIIWSFA